MIYKEHSILARKYSWIIALLLLSCSTKNEKGLDLLEQQVKSKIETPDSYEFLALDTLDYYSVVKDYVVRLTYSYQDSSNQTAYGLEFAVINDSLILKGSSDDIRGIDTYLKLSTYHEYAKKIDFSDYEQIGNFDVVSTERLRKIDLKSRGFE